MLVLDATMRVVFWNSVLEQWTGIQRDKILGHDIRERFLHFKKARYSRRLESLFDGGPPAVFSSQLHPHFLPAPLPSGRMRVLDSLAVPVPKDIPGLYDALIAVQDVSSLADAMDALRQSRRRAEELAATDPLTGVANRRQFLDLGEKALSHARRNDNPCTILMLDIDHFKEINDRYGHPSGDEVLCMIVRVFRQTLRRSDIVARVGGDEFSILLLDTDTKIGQITADRLRKSVTAESLLFDDQEIQVHLSIGVAGLQPESDNLEKLILRADNALYEAKRNGRNRVVAY